ncbi:hypothetical protein ACFLRF_03720 [Candidatus Altiarchaeota archaeon]
MVVEKAATGSHASEVVRLHDDPKPDLFKPGREFMGRSIDVGSKDAGHYQSEMDQAEIISDLLDVRWNRGDPGALEPLGLVKYLAIVPKEGNDTLKPFGPQTMIARFRDDLKDYELEEITRFKQLNDRKFMDNTCDCDPPNTELGRAEVVADLLGIPWDMTGKHALKPEQLWANVEFDGGPKSQTARFKKDLMPSEVRRINMLKDGIMRVHSRYFRKD